MEAGLVKEYFITLKLDRRKKIPLFKSKLD